MHGNIHTLTMIGVQQMFFKKSRKIKELEDLVRYYKRRNVEQTNLVRVLVNDLEKYKKRVADENR